MRAHSEQETLLSILIPWFCFAKYICEKPSREGLAKFPFKLSGFLEYDLTGDRKDRKAKVAEWECNLYK